MVRDGGSGWLTYRAFSQFPFVRGFSSIGGSTKHLPSMVVAALRRA